MHVFYTPDIQKNLELPEEEAQHCVRVLRLNIGDEITLTDGNGNFYRAEITAATNKRCFVKILFMVRTSTHSHGSNKKYGS